MNIINQEFSDSLSSKDLEMFGLTNYEAKTYFNMLPLGLTKAKDISNISNIPFGRIYEVLTSLEHKGLLEKQDSRPKRYLAREPKIAIKNLIDYKDQELSSIKESASIVEEKLTQLYSSSKEESLFWSIAMDEETMDKHSQKLMEAEKEVLIYVNMSSHEAIFPNNSAKDTMEVFELLIQEKNVDVKILFGAITEKEFKNQFLEQFAPFMYFLKDIDVKFTSAESNTFDIIDKEKVILKILNPVDSKEFLAMIFLWQKSFAGRLRNKFFELWKSAKELKVDFQMQ